MGRTVRVAETSSIGVHKTSFADTSAISVGDAVSRIQHQTAKTISYMTEIGIDPSLLQLSLRYEKDDMRYLSKKRDEQYRVTTLGKARPPPGTEVSANTQPSASKTAALPHHTIETPIGRQRTQSLAPDQNPDWMRENTRLVKREICAPTNGAEKAMATMTAMIFGTKVSVIS